MKFNFFFQNPPPPVSWKIMFDLKLVSNILGWLYVTSWGIFSYPQIFLNYKLRRWFGFNKPVTNPLSFSVEGLKLDYAFLNVTGFTFCSAAYSIAFFKKDLPMDHYGYGTVKRMEEVTRLLIFLDQNSRFGLHLS